MPVWNGKDLDMAENTPRCVSTLRLALACGALAFCAGPPAATGSPAGDGRDTESRDRLAWTSFVNSLDARRFAADYPGPLRDLDSGETEKTVVALNVLGASGAIAAIPRLVPLLDAPDRQIRIHAGLNLERIVSGVELKRRDPRHLDRIVLRPRTGTDPDLTPLRWVVRKMLTAEDDGNTQGYAATMAAYIGLPDLEEELRALLKSRHPAVTRSAVHALRTLGFAVDREPHPSEADPPERLRSALNDAGARATAEGLAAKLAVPMTADDYAGYVERMGRCPDRFDYLYEAAFAHCYAARQRDDRRQEAVLTKARKYYETWRKLNEPGTKSNEFYTRLHDYIPGMIARYQAILDHAPDHPYRQDLDKAMRELEGFQKPKEEARQRPLDGSRPQR